MEGWSFTLDMSLGDRDVRVTRNTENPNRVEVEGDVEDLPVQSEHRDGTSVLHVNDWNSALGEVMFGLSARESLPKYHPTFRSLISYLIRRGREGFASPFLHHRTQQEWDKQINNAYLLSLAWEHAG